MYNNKIHYYNSENKYLLNNDDLSNINTNINNKTFTITGVYTSNNTKQRFINVGYPIKAVLIIRMGYTDMVNYHSEATIHNNYVYGGLALLNNPLYVYGYTSNNRQLCLNISGNGFYVYNQENVAGVYHAVSRTNYVSSPTWFNTFFYVCFT